MRENRKVAKAVLLMALVAGLCRMASFAKEAYVVYVFGPGPAIDAFSLAILVPALLTALFLHAVRRAFFTQYPSHAEMGAASAERYGNLFLTSLFSASVALALLFSFLISPILGLMARSTNPEVTGLLARLALPAVWLIVPMTLIVGFTTLLNARGSFSMPTLTALFPPACIVSFVLAKGSEWGAESLIWGLLAGSWAQSAVLLYMLLKAGHRAQMTLSGPPDLLRDLWRFSLPIILLEVLVQANATVGRNMAATLAPGRVSILYWSATLKEFISSMLVATLLTVLLPHFSEQVAAKATAELRRSCALIIRYGAMTMFPISVFLVLCGPAALRQIRFGKLDPEAARLVAWCLAAYGLGLFGDFVASAFVQALMALRQMRTLVLFGIFAYFIPNILFNLILIRYAEVVGLALSTTLVSYTTLVCNYWALRKVVGMEDERKNLRVVLGCLLAAAAMALVAFGSLELARSVRPGGPLADLLAALAAGTTGLGVYVFLLLVYPGNEDARAVWRILRDKCRSRTARESK